MTLIVPEGYSEILFVFGSPFTSYFPQITFGVLNGEGFSNSEVRDLLEPIADAVVPNVICNDANLVGFGIKAGPNETGPFDLFPYVVNGDVGGTSGNMATSLLVSKGTALGGRGNSGRNYWPFQSESVVDAGGGFQPGFLDDAQAALTQMLEDLETAQIPMVLLRSNEDGPVAVTSLTAQTACANQRRRQRPR